MASLVAQLAVKNPPAMREMWVRSLGWEDPLEKGKGTQSSILAWKIPRTVELMESQRVVGTSAHPLPSCWDDGRADFIQECSNAKNIEKFWNHVLMSS